MNIYFIIIACLQFWSIISPVNPIATWAPLLFLFAISALKEGGKVTGMQFI
jgi:phospholipid-translocating ATPase